MSILVTAASGQLGHLVVDHLLERGADPADVVAGARTVEKAADLAERGVRVVHLDYEDPATVDAALEGVEKVLLISSDAVGKRAAQHQVVIDAAARAGVSLLAYTSLINADTTSSPLAPEHRATEQAIADAGLTSVLLRNGWYAENYAANVAAASATGELVSNVGAGRVAAASRSDLAEAAAVVLLGEGHAGRTYELAGESLSYEQVAAAIGEVAGREVAHRPVSAEEHAEILRAAGLDDGTIGFVTAVDTGIVAGDLDSSDTALAELLGRPTTPLVDALRAVV